MRVLIADDEPLARERLAALVGDAGSEVVASVENGERAVEAAERLQPEVCLLDIRMPGMDGLDAARLIGQLANPPAVVFCTAYDEYALKAFDAHAVDYVMKPVRRERLEQALARAARLSGGKVEKVAQTLGPQRQRSHICARVRGNLVLVPVEEILYLQAEDKYVVVHHVKGQVLVEDALKGLEDEFGDQFVRIHRNCLVARARMSGLTRGSDGRVFVRIDGASDVLEVSRRNLPALRKLVRNL
ncbi:LytTR family two component transcriptional regulator [Tahibacter aquaticus]|uniref:LytTR family two component transcriptional regulator n=1 Tax=Tahibacter aquaticus TaxID=520092 RepID=A0A4R6YQZ7_9GAMM|nr:LytTR family DNA-binding domain-containing protein [Tahibacter aquaticus]TDR40395.1 LytTR family two component transcriptional regulator [Tahibacter aquaticus]